MKNVYKYEGICIALRKLLNMHLEVFIVDSQTNEVVLVEGRISALQVGEIYDIDAEVKNMAFDPRTNLGHIFPYPKLFRSKDVLKCIATPLMDDNGEIEGMMFIRMNPARYREIHRMMGVFLSSIDMDTPDEIKQLKNAHENLEFRVALFLDNNGLTEVEHLDKAMIVDLYSQLKSNGDLAFKGSIKALAMILHRDYTTIYRYIKSDREK